MPQLTDQQAADHYESAYAEVQRLSKTISMRGMAEKKLLGTLQQLLPKLKRYARDPKGGSITDAEQTALAGLISVAPAADATPAPEPKGAKAEKSEKAEPKKPAPEKKKAEPKAESKAGAKKKKQ